MARSKTDKSSFGVDVARERQACKDDRIQKILDDAGAALKAEGAEYLIGAVDRQPEAEDGGKVHVQHDMKSENFIFILDAAMQTREDLVRVGMWVGQMLAKGKQ